MENQPDRKLVWVDPTIYMTLTFVGIVLFLHHVSYNQDYLWAITHYFFNPYKTGLDEFLQKFAVGGFLFLSGYKLAISKRSDSVRAFLENRFYRIYPLYLLAVIVYSFTAYPYQTEGQLPSWGNFLLHALGLQSFLPNFFGENYQTIWFVSNLFFCYLAFIFLRRSLGSTRTLLAGAIVFLLAIYCIRSIASSADIALFSGHFDTYFVFFVFGMVSYQHQSKFAKVNTILAVAVAVVCLMGFLAFRMLLPDRVWFHYPLDRVLMLAGTIPIYIGFFRGFQDTLIPSDIAEYAKNLCRASFCVFLISSSGLVAPRSHLG